MNKDSSVYIAGINGMVGSAIRRQLEKKGYTHVWGHSSKDIDLRNQLVVENLFEKEKPEYVFLAAAKVGGIKANNTYRADFLADNLMIQTNVITSAHRSGVKKLLFLGSSCIYPKASPQPIKEEYLLTGALEPTNEPYAIAKISGIKMCEAFRDQYGANFISVMPTNLYGPGDNYDLENSHVLPALIRKFHEAKLNQSRVVELWGTGESLREFLHVDDLAEACVFLMETYDQRQFLNIGCSEDITIKSLAGLVKNIIGYTGEITFNGQLEGTHRKLLDCSRINALGWRPRILLQDGIRATYERHLNEL